MDTHNSDLVLIKRKEAGRNVYQFDWLISIKKVILHQTRESDNSGN